MSEPSGLHRLWTYAAPHRGRVFLASTYSALGKVMDVVPEVLIGVVLDVIVRGQDSFFASAFGVTDRWQQLLYLSALNALVWVLESLCGYLSALTWRNLAQAIQHDIRVKLYAHVQNLEIAYFEDQTSGGLLSVINDDINQLERFLDSGADRIIVVFLNVILVGAVFASSSPTLTAMAFAPIPLIIWGSNKYQRHLTPLYARVRETVSELSATISTNLGGIATIKAFNSESREAMRLQRDSENYRLANRDAIRFSSGFVPLIRMFILSGFTCTLIYGGWLTLNGQMLVGVYTVLVFMTQRLLWPMTSLGETLDLYQRAMASTSRIFNLMQTKPAMHVGAAALESPVRGDVEFRDVSFRYATGEDVLDHVSIVVPSGETHGIVGSTGSGKSTILRLLLRFYDPQTGMVLVDGIDVRELSSSSLRNAIGYVSQDVFLFHGSVRENIAYGKPDATNEEIEAAARSAEAHNFIQALPSGYDTVVGERGQKLSGGQRQRISLARAILRNPTILVLDEATSAVDNETEAAIQRSLKEVTKGRTSLVVAHRLSTVRDAHKIWVLERGRVIEAGTHDELVRIGGLYAALWRVQTGAH